MTLEVKKHEYLKFNKSLNEEYLLLQEKYSQIYGKDKSIVLMQVGGFHEIYATNERGYNLHKLSNLLNVVMSKKDKKRPEVSEKNPYMIGFPIVATPKYLKMLVELGFHVIKIDQVTDSPTPKRAITGIYSPGTFIEDMKSTDANYILSIFIEEIQQINNSYMLYIGLSIIDLSVGKSIIHETFAKKDDDKYSLDETLMFIHNFNPSEIIIYHKNLVTYNEEQIKLYLELNDKKYLYYELDKNEYLRLDYQNNLLKSVFTIETYLSAVEDLDLEKINNGRASYILLLDYCKRQNSSILSNLHRPEFYENNKYLHLGNNAIDQLNILPVNNKSDSLFDIINFTHTSMGKRFLKFNLSNPICESNILNDRYEFIDDLKSNNIDLSNFLKNIIDIERLHRKISLKTLNPCEFYYLNDTYKEILNLYDGIGNLKIKKLFSKSVKNELLEFISYYNKIFDFEEISKYILQDIGGSFFNKNINKEIDNLQKKVSDKKDEINDIKCCLEKYIDNGKKDYFNSSSDEKSLINLSYNETEKFYFLITQKRAASLQSKFPKKQKTDKYKKLISLDDFRFKNQSSSTKLTSKLLDEISDQITLSLDKLKILVKTKYLDYLEEIYKKYSKLFSKLNDIISEVDFINSGYLCALKNRYCRPKIIDSEESFVNGKSMRHPIIEKIIFNKYVPHNMKLGKEEKGILLYGLNSAGKSSLMKSIGLNIILAQIGYFTCAEKFEFSPYHSIFTRISNNDNIYKGLSSFALELVELKAILKRSGSKSLVLADEVCKGTEYNSALVIVSTMIKMLVQSKTTFVSATHLHELIKLNPIKEISNLGVYHIKVRYEGDNIIFDRILEKGNGPEEYGLDFAKYIIKDKKFFETTSLIKNELESDLFNLKKSRYNNKMLVDKCDICNSKDKLETHHIEFQQNSDKYGFIIKDELKHVSVHHTSNLVILCEKCHDKVHDNLILIKGYEETAKGNILNIEIADKKEGNKFNNEELVFLKDFRSKKINQKNIKKLFDDKFNKKISIKDISNILKQDI